MIAVVIAATLAPIIAVAQKLGVPRWLATILVYLGFNCYFDRISVSNWSDCSRTDSKTNTQVTILSRSVRSLIDNLAMRFGMTEPGNAHHN